MTTNRPEIAVKIESYQHFSNDENSWLPKFMELNNENKHQRLTPQTRKEVKQLNIKSGGGGASISLGGGASISLGRDGQTLPCVVAGRVEWRIWGHLSSSQARVPEPASATRVR